MTETMILKADNTNVPLWKRVALRIVENEGELTALQADERASLLENAIKVMKPSAEEQEVLAQDDAKQNEYLLTFVRAYKAGLPPYSSVRETAGRPQA